MSSPSNKSFYKNKKNGNSPSGVNPVLRARSRRRALQAIYAWQITGGSAQQMLLQFAHEQAIEQADLPYFNDLVEGVIREKVQLDAFLLPFLDRTVDEVDAIERAVLRLATYELKHRLDIPYRVVLNEAIEIAKKFGSEHGHTFVNGVLDQAAVEWRPLEFTK